MSLTDIQEKIDALTEVIDRLGQLLCDINEVNWMCSNLDLEGSHHAEMEYGRSMKEAESRLEEIQRKVSQLEGLL
jgi:hypothetical protein